MKCHDVELLISAKLDGEVTASEWREAEQHIAGCAHCAEMHALFAQSDSFVQTHAIKSVPTRNLWPGIAGQLDRRELAWWHKIADRWRDFWQSVSPPGARWRYVLAGFAAAAVLFIAALLSWRVLGDRPDAEQASLAALQLGVPIQDFAKLPREQGLALYRRAALVQEIQHYFAQTGLLLMEIKNSDAENNLQMLESMRATSKMLLDETVVIKKALEDHEMALVHEVVEQIETALFDVANIKEDASNDDFELIKASILRKDLLIKIEIIDLDKMSNPMPDTDSSLPANYDASSQI